MSGNEQRGVEPPADGDGVVADRVDAAVDDAQPADLDAVIDLAGGQAEGEQLRAIDHPALTTRDPADLLVRCT
jgi:hypothetical protein